MHIRVIGLPAAKTIRTLTNVQEAASLNGGDITVHWVSDPRDMLAFGAMQTPSVIVNEELRVAGRIPSIFEVGNWIEQELTAEEMAA